MPRTRGGDRNAAFHVFQRRLVLIRRLLRGPAPATTLISEVQATLGEEAYPGDAANALRHDIVALRDEMICTINYDGRNGYTLENLGLLTLLDLPDADLETLSFLSAVFAAETFPHSAEVTTLIERILQLLPEERRRLVRQATPTEVDFPESSSTMPLPIIASLKRAIGRQYVRFSYRSNYVGPHEHVEHLVVPYRLLYRDGHAYVDGYCVESAGQPRNKATLYRVDRILAGTVQVQRKAVPPGSLPQRKYFIRYVLSAQVARHHDFALWFDQSRTLIQPDGRVEVEATTTDLWQARRVLLRYGEECEILEPPELLEMIRSTIERMRALYLRTAQPLDMVEG